MKLYPECVNSHITRDKDFACHTVISASLHVAFSSWCGRKILVSLHVECACGFCSAEHTGWLTQYWQKFFYFLFRTKLHWSKLKNFKFSFPILQLLYYLKGVWTKRRGWNLVVTKWLHCRIHAPFLCYCLVHSRGGVTQGAFKMSSLKVTTE